MTFEHKFDALAAASSDGCADWSTTHAAELLESDTYDRVGTVQGDLHPTLRDLLELWAISLDERQCLILRHRVVRRDRTLEDLGNELGVSRARVGQLEKKLVDNFAELAADPSDPRADRRVRATGL